MRHITAVLFLFPLLIASTAFGLGDGKVHIFFVDVGQGDGAVIIGPQGTSVLLDGGASNSSRANLEAAMNYAISAGLTDNTLDYCVNSHMHSDHFGAMELVAQTFAGGLVWAYDRGGSYSSTAYTEYNNYFGGTLNKRKTAQTFSIGTNCTMVYCGHPTAGTGDENNNGVLYRLDFGNFKAALCGDLGGSYEINFAPAIGDIDHYKANHHGSNTSSQNGWLNITLPRTHTFSYGVGNSYGHPTSGAITRCADVGSTRYDTNDHEGNGKPWVHLITDGVNNYSVNGQVYPLSGGPPPEPPAAPSSLTAAPAGSSQINLAWADNSSDETGFEVLRGTSNGGPYAIIATTGANAETYSNGSLSAGTTYYYVVRAVNGNGSSGYSNQASATTDAASPLPAAPSALTGSAVSQTQINISWTDNSANESNFVVERKSGKNGTYGVVATLGSNVTSFNNTGLVRATSYSYRVKATNAAGSSAYSNVLTIKTLR